MSFANVNQMLFGVSIQRGDINNFSGIQKFGYNSSGFELILEKIDQS
jgi:hypothetical protein